MAKLERIRVKDAIAVRNDICRTIRNGLRAQGRLNAQVGPESDFFLTAAGLGNELAVIGANAIVRADGMMPDSAEEEDLTRQGVIVDRPEQAAAGSAGNVLIRSSADSPIETDAELTDAAGQRFGVVTGGIYADGDPVAIYALVVGAATNHAEGDVLQWTTAPPFCDPNVTVDEGGLTNGSDVDEPEVHRARILAVYQTPPGGGNWEQVAETAEDSHPSVKKCFVHPCVQGPATMDVVVVAAPSATSKSRVLASTTLAYYVIPAVTGEFPVPAEGVTVTTVTDVNATVAIALSLPEAATASPAGLGGGWLDGTPWPAPDGAYTFAHYVTAVVDANHFTVDAQTAPIAGVTHICWLSPTSWQLYTGLVIAVSGSAGAYAITVDTPFSDIMVAACIWPACQNAQTYVDALLANFALLGPGEKTSNYSALVRGFRHPAPGAAWPYSLGPTMLRAITDAGEEVLAAQFLYRTDGATAISGGGGALTPQPPSSMSDPSNIFVPLHIGFYRLAIA